MGVTLFLYGVSLPFARTPATILRPHSQIEDTSGVIDRFEGLETTRQGFSNDTDPVYMCIALSSDKLLLVNLSIKTRAKKHCREEVLNVVLVGLKEI